ncbi:MAG: hypothetical protein MUO97_10095, partial [Dehalococcoidia bacterium]|nr:hypothetical protein [Dehalococcoidia bacterium]
IFFVIVQNIVEYNYSTFSLKLEVESIEIASSLTLLAMTPFFIRHCERSVAISPHSFWLGERLSAYPPMWYPTHDIQLFF